MTTPHPLTTWTAVAWLEHQAITAETQTGTNVHYAHRPLTPTERAAGTRFGDLDKITTTATQRLTQLITDLYTTATTLLIADALANLEGDDNTVDVAALIALLLLLLGNPPKKITAQQRATAEQLATELGDIYTTGAATYYDDLNHQGVTTNYPTPTVPATLAALAVGVTAHPFTRIVTRLLNEYQTPGKLIQGTVPTAEVTEFIQDTPQQGTIDQLNQATQTALAEGRAGAAEQSLDAVVAWAASEVLDGGTCSACAAIDETIFHTWEEARAAYPTGTYKNCAGGQRCRGQLIPLTEPIAPTKTTAP